MAEEDYVLERIIQLLEKRLSGLESTDLARQIIRTIQPGDDLGNGLRAIPIAALEELTRFLDRNTQ